MRRAAGEEVLSCVLHSRVKFTCSHSAPCSGATIPASAPKRVHKERKLLVPLRAPTMAEHQPFAEVRRLGVCQASAADRPRSHEPGNRAAAALAPCGRCRRRRPLLYRGRPTVPLPPSSRPCAQDYPLQPLVDDCRLLNALLDDCLRIEVGDELFQKVCGCLHRWFLTGAAGGAGHGPWQG